MATIGSILAALFAQVIDQQPDLLMLKTWLLYHHGHTDQLPTALRRVEGVLAQTDMPPDAARHLQGEISALVSLLAYYQTDPARTMAAAEFALANTPAELWIVRILARLFLAGAYQMQGDARHAQTTILHGSQEETVDSHSFKATMLLSACFVFWVTGELERLRQTAQRCIDYCDYPNSAEIEGYRALSTGACLLSVE